MTMPNWSLVAAGHIPDTDTHATGTLTEQLAAVLSRPEHGTRLSELRIDGPQPVKVTLHAG